MAPKASLPWPAQRGCSDATLSRLLEGLQAAGMVEGGSGAPYRSTAYARDLGAAIAGQGDPRAAVRRELAELSAIIGTGCAWFRIEAGGVRCLVRQLVPRGWLYPRGRHAH